MRRVVIVAVREFLETVRTKAFLFGAIFMPMIMVAFIFGTQKLMKLTENDVVPERRLLLIDRSGVMTDFLQTAIANYNNENPKRPFGLEIAENPETDVEAARETARTRVMNEKAPDKLYAYIEIPPGALDGTESPQIARVDGQVKPFEEISEMLKNSVRYARSKSRQIGLPDIMFVLQHVNVASIDVKAGTTKVESDTGRMARILTPFVFMFILWMGTLGISQGLLTSVLEEKSSRIVEVLLSAVSPMQLMAGKILGSVCVGLMLMGIWAIAGGYASKQIDMGSSVSVTNAGYLALYFLPAFLFSAAIMGAIGSACNSLKEAQSLSSPMMIMNIVPMMLWFPLTQGPNSMLAIVLSFIPPITPFVMVLRLCSDPHIPMWQIVATQIVLWAAVFVALWFAAKVFRIGILMYGKAPTIREMMRWARYA